MPLPSLDFDDEMKVGDVEEAIYSLELKIKGRFPVVRRLFIEVQKAEHHAMEVKKAREER